MGGSQQKHDWLQQKLFNHPEFIDIPKFDIHSKAMEYELYLNNTIYVVPDLYFQREYYTHFVEIKSGSNHTAYSRGMNQLEKIIKWAETENLSNIDAKLVMPKYNDDFKWNHTLMNLEIYKLGDSYKKKGYYSINPNLR